MACCEPQDEKITTFFFDCEKYSKEQLKKRALWGRSGMYDNLFYFQVDNLTIAAYLESATEEDTYPKEADGTTKAKGNLWKYSHIAEIVLGYFKKASLVDRIKAVYIFRNQSELKHLYKVFNIISQELFFEPESGPSMFQYCEKCCKVKQHGQSKKSQFYDNILWSDQENN